MGAAKLQYTQTYQLAMTTQSDFESSHSLHLEDVSEDVEETEAMSQNERTINSNDLMMPSSTSHEYWVISILILWGITLSTVVFIPMPNDERADIIGIIVNLNLIVFYGAPLSTIVHVFKTKSSRSIHRRTLGT